MIEQIKKNEENIINNISLLKSNKNPLSVLFVLADLKDLFISISETLLNSIELSYSQDSKKQYFHILNAYKEAHIFESIYNFYLSNDGVLKFKKDIDHYFQSSFFIDISFFYFTVSRKDIYGIIFDMLEVFYTDKNIKNNYFLLETYLEKKDYLNAISSSFQSLTFDKDMYYIIKFLNYFQNFDFEKIELHFNNTIPSNIKIIKAITGIVFENPQKYHDIYELFLTTFVFDEKIYSEVIEKLEENKLFEVISFLKNDLLSGIEYSFPLDYETKSYIKELLHQSYVFSNFEIDEKINFLLFKEKTLISLWSEKWDFARISFKRQFLETRYSDIIDLTMGINSLPQDVFYLLKQKNHTLDLGGLTIYNEVKDLILYIENSYFLWLTRPFLLKNISNYFNSSDQKYYIIKFILSVVLSSSYSEYQKITKFFFNLESFYKKDFLSFLSRIMQFWWIIILFFILSLFAPFWVMVSIILLILRQGILHIFSHFFPKLKMSLNFQITTFASILWTIALVLSITIWYNENVHIIYDKFRYVINSISLPSSESFKALYGDSASLKADIIGSKVQ